MYGSGVRNGLAGAVAYGGASRSGLGEIDLFDVAVADGIAPNTDAGKADLETIHRQGITPAIIEARPEAAAFLAATSTGADYGTPVQQIIDGLTRSYDATLLLGAVSPAAAARYIAAITRYVPIFQAFVAQRIAGYTDPAYQATVGAAAAWQTALANGPLLQTPHGPIPSIYVAEGPVTLPDGTVYLVVDDPRTPGGVVLWWEGPTFVQAQPLNAFIRGGDCAVVRGTGDWYRLAAMGNTCGVPDGWTGGFGLLSARARASLLPATPGANQDAPTTAPSVTPITAPPAVLYQSPTAPPASPGTTSPAPAYTAAPAASPALYQSPTTVPAPTMTPVSTTPQPGALYQSPMSNAPDVNVTVQPPAAAAPEAGPWTAVVAIATLIGAVAAWRSYQKRGGSKSWQ